MLKTKETSKEKLEILTERLNQKLLIYEGREMVAVATKRWLFYVENASSLLKEAVEYFAKYPPIKRN